MEKVLPMALCTTFIICFVMVNADFILTVNFTNYINPSGLCAECNTRLATPESLAQIVPVCCDESPFKTDNCDNTGEARCDTRFRWTLRPFGASLETRPATVPNTAGKPPYNFNRCPSSSTTCPFSEVSKTFEQGDMAFLESPNPLSISSSEPWMGRIQFFIESVESGVPNIIDSFLINLDNLQLGADFTEEMIFTGYHNISHMTISFKVECAPNFCGIDCQTTTLNNPLVSSCANNGEVVCNEDRFDPSTSCTTCLHNLIFLTDCSTCLDPNFDPDTNCSACLTGFDRSTDCLTCLSTNYDPTTNCSTCFNKYDLANNCSTCINTNFNPLNSCTSCVQDGLDPTTNCSLCLPNRELSTNCTQCSPGWDIDSDCMSCLFGRDPDSEPGCIECLPGRDLSTNCTTCLSGYAGKDCMEVTLTPPTLSVAQVGGIAGGVVGALMAVILVLIVVAIVLVSHMTRHGRGHYNPPGETVTEDIDMKQNPVYGVTTAEPTTQTTTDDIQLQPNVLYGVNTTETERYNYYENEGLGPPQTESEQPNEYDYIEIGSRHKQHLR